MSTDDLFNQAEQIDTDPVATAEEKQSLWKAYAESADPRDPRRTQAIQRYMYWSGVAGKKPDSLHASVSHSPSSQRVSCVVEENIPTAKLSSVLLRFVLSYFSSLSWCLILSAPIAGLLVMAEVLGIGEVGFGVGNDPDAGMIALFTIVGVFAIMVATGFGISWSRTKLRASPSVYNHGILTQIAALLAACRT